METVGRIQDLSIEAAADLITRAKKAYFFEGDPIITDADFDLVEAHLRRLDPKNSALLSIGAPIEGAQALPFFMPSLEKIKDDPKALEKFVKRYPGPYVMSDKLDGNSGGLVIDSKGTRLYSRGNGEYGQDLSALLPYIKGIPKKEKGRKMMVRGELIISRKDWLANPHIGANARNVAAGVLHSKTVKTEVAALVQFVAYELIEPKMPPSEGLEFLTKAGFTMVDWRVLETVSFDQLSGILVDRRKNSPFECDGIVILHNAEHRAVKGQKYPPYAFALKSVLLQDEAEVTVTEVIWNTSKDGLIKPTITFEPVVLNGATIRRVTGFNAAYIETNKIGVGSRLVIIRSGDVIPHILRVISPSSSGRPDMPTQEFDWTDTHVDAVATQESSQMDQKRLIHFVTVMDIKGVGPGIVQRLYENGYNTVPRLLKMTTANVTAIDGFQERAATNIVTAIAKAVKANGNCVNWAVASNVFGRGFGTRRLKSIIDAFPTIASGDSPTMETLSGIPGIGAINAQQFIDALPDFHRFMKSVGHACVREAATGPTGPATVPTGPAHVPTGPATPSGKFINQQIVFTGVRDKEMEAMIEAEGGRVTSTVSKKTTLVVAKEVDERSSKITKAKELGITIMSLVAFKDKFL